MTVMVYQARIGDGFRKKGFKRINSYFNTPQEAVSEALALKDKMDSIYENKIEWDYTGEIKGDSENLKILRGYLSGDKKSKPFYLQISTVKPQKGYSIVDPREPKKMTQKYKKVMKNVTKIFSA